MEEAKTQNALRAELLAKAAADDGFRAKLIDDPKAAIEEAFGLAVPQSVNVLVHEDTAQEAHLVLPPSAGLTDADLEAVAAGHVATGGLYSDDPDWHYHPNSGEWHGGAMPRDG